MAPVETIAVELVALTEKFDKRIRSSADGLDRQLRGIEGSANRQERSFRRSTESQADAMRDLEGQVTDSSTAIGNQFKTLAGTLAAAFSVQQISALADSYTRFTNTLAVNGLEGQNLANVQQQLFEIAQRYGVELESLGTLFGRASQAGKDLGASQAQLLQFSEGVSAALKVQGGSAAEASGALLQLSQALAGGIVRAEEFNSINEGALPILKAVAANLDGAGGSVAKLRALVLDGQVTSAAFFQAFLQGSEGLKAQAASTTLTIENSFTVLNNALGKYIGETDQSLSATEQVSAAIIKLSENIDIVAAAVAALSVLLIGRFAGSMFAAAASSGAASTAIFALQARALGAATTMEALAFTSRAAGTAMLAAFGGPVGLAVTVLAGSVLLLATNTETADDKIAGLNARIEDAEGKAATYEARLRDAGVAVDAIGSASDVASGKVANLADQMRAAGDEALALFKKLNGLELIKIGKRLNEIKDERGELRERPSRRPSNDSAGSPQGAIGRLVRGAVETILPGKLAQTEGKRIEQIQKLTQEESALLRQVELIRIAGEKGVDLAEPAGTGGGGVPEKEKKAKAQRAARAPREPKAPTGPTAAEIEARFLSELSRLNAEELQAKAALATDIIDRADLFQELLQLERAEREKQIENDKDFTRAQKDAQLEALDRLFGVEGGGVDAAGNITVSKNRERGLLEQQIERDLKQQQLQQAQELLGLEADALDAQAAITFALDDRFALEQRALEIGQEIESQLLEQRIANGEIAEADKARALLAQRQAAQREEQGLDQQSPFEQFRQDLTTTSLNLNDALENIGVDALKNINDELTDAIVNFNSFGDVGRAVLRGLTTQLVQLALQQILLKTIGAAAGSAAVATTTAQAAATGAAWAPAAAAASLATLGSNAGPAAIALTTTTALAQALAATGGLKDGGPVSGPGGPRDDKILKRLSAGEYVINAGASSALGRQALDFMNATGQLPGMRASGGPAVPGFSIPNSPAMAGGGGGSSSIDQASLARLEQLLGDATRAMPPVQLFPTLDAGDALAAGLASPGGQRVFFDFVQNNSGRFSSAVNQ